jgi:ATP-binding cassette subfamily B protein
MSDATGFDEKEYASKVDMGIWKKIARFGKPLWPAVALLALTMTSLAVVDTFFPRMLKYAIDELVPDLGTAGIERRIVQFVLVYSGLGLLQGISIVAFHLFAGTIEVRMVHILRGVAFRRLQDLSFSYYDRTPAGWIMSRLTSDAQRLGDTIAWGLVDLVWGNILILAVIVSMFLMNARLALISLAFMPFLIVATWWFQKKILAAQRKARKANSLLSGIFNEGLQGARTSKTLVREGRNCDEFTKRSARLREHALKAAKLSALYMPIVILLSSTGAAVALGAGGSLAISGGLTLGSLAAFVNYAMMLFDPAREVARVLSEFQAAQASAERLLGLIETKSEIVDEPDATDGGKIGGDLELSHVTFGYGEDRPIFEDFSLKIPAGQTIAIVGETGSGKSTLVNLLCRFYEPRTGEILIDGKDYRTRPQHWLHKQLGYVLQTPLLFSGTIRENIRYGRLDATDAEIEAAARDANAIGFIERLEKGFDTMVGEGGVLLSTGQKQLISLARALVADPRIMVLDEATSSVDTETEVLIQGAVDRLLAGRTSIVIAHRLSTIRNADRILVMENGHIIEEGDHEALLAKRGYYWRLYTRQFLDEESLAKAANG